ncbi:cation/acetate symporter, partial [Amycolatopsis regifaucium]
MSPLAAGVQGSDPALNITIFAVFVAITLVIVFRASRNTKTASDYYA